MDTLRKSWKQLFTLVATDGSKDTLKGMKNYELKGSYKIKN